MNKAQCLDAVVNAGVARSEAIDRFSLYMVAFGRQDELTKHAERDVEEATAAMHEWRKIAEWHPKTRDAALKNKTLPDYLFKFV